MIKLTAALLMIALSVSSTAYADTSLDVPRAHPPLSERVGITAAWEATGFAMPESVTTAAGLDWIYVSNVAGDDAGFISCLNKYGTVDALKWAEVGGSPTGLAINDGVLYAGNFTQVSRVDLATGEVLAAIASDAAKALNDIAVGPEGRIFVSDVVGGTVYELVDDALVPFVSDPQIALPNGVLVKGRTLFIGDTAGGLSPDFSPATYGSVYSVDLAEKVVSVVPTAFQLGAVDGVAQAGGVTFASSNQTGELFAFTDRERVLLGTFKPGLADVGVFGDMLFAPFLFDNTIVAFKLTIAE